MWLSRNFKNPEQSAAENGVVTLSAENSTEANSSLPSRTSECFSPYGYSFRLPVGEEVLIVNSASGAAVAGSKMKTQGLAQGEVEIRSLGGARILLKNDGSVVINSLVINRDGEFEKG